MKPPVQSTDPPATLEEIWEQIRSSRTQRRPGANDAYGNPTMRVPNPLPFLIFLASVVLGWTLAGGTAILDEAGNFLRFAGIVFVGGLLASTIKIAAQWERALVFRLGKYHAVKGPGPFFVVPVFDSVRMVDTRIATLDIPRQQAITMDNVPVSIDGVIFMRVDNPADAVIQVQDFQHAIRQYAQTTLRDIIGNVTLDQLLNDREAVGERIQSMVRTEIHGWGLEVAAIRIQDIELPEDLKRVMARQAAAEREKRANITKSEGDRAAAENLAAAAMTMQTSPGALQLRTLQTLDGLGSSASNTVVLALPVEVLEAVRSIPGLADAISQGAKSLPASPTELTVLRQSETDAENA